MKGKLILSVLEPAGIARKNEFIQIGIPLPAGQFYSIDEIKLFTKNSVHIPSTRTATAHWPDKSIKWCLLQLTLSLEANENKSLFLQQSDTRSPQHEFAPLISEKNDSIFIKTKNYEFQFNNKVFKLFEQVTKDGQNILHKGDCYLLTDDGQNLVASVNDYNYRTAYTEQDPLYSEISFSGQFKASVGTPTINFNARLTFHIESDFINCEITLHNPNRSTHLSGKWDLGDINSLSIKDFSVGFSAVNATEIKWKAELEQQWSTLNNSKLNIYQESSGGENWDSPNHKNKDNRVPMSHQGYICEFDDKQQSGRRASPVIKLCTSAGDINISVDKFWQNFPRSISIDSHKVELGLFAKQFPEPTELQPGEKKTHNFQLNFGNQVDNTARAKNPVTTRLDRHWINHCQVFTHELLDSKDDPVEAIIEQGLSSQKYNFFAKRETLDEYGWRNFGDLYADHETSGYEGKDIFVSHYNNQYDPLYGFLYQFMLTGNSQWFELANDIAGHITDIDIYHTTFDKYEYNGGLFWHTDHYVKAFTSSHRSYSKDQVYIYENYEGGGGPGGQHCYTAGLLHHYLLTGSESSKQAVFQLCNWISHIYDGSGTLFGFLIAIKNRNRIGLKNILTGKYPFDRGTGYYMNALLDKYYLTSEIDLVKQVGLIIRNTVHPNDDISSRNLDNVETTWFYTIFFQSVSRYLKTKEELSELDDDFYYARDALLHYADWMGENEYPYLEKPEILEYPNQTWTAQDIRKVRVLLYADYYSNQPQQKYLEKAHEIYQYINDSLSNEPTRTYSRILAILMQNSFPHSALEASTKVNHFEPVRSYEPLSPASTFLIARNLTSEFFKIMRHFSVKKEMNWLTQRSQFFAKIFGNR